MSTPSVAEQKLLALRSGNVCAFRGCTERLITDGPHGDSTLTGEVAHVIADSRQGPRGDSSLTDAERDKADNLVYLCEKHHKVVDRHPRVYSVAVLRQMKTDHEERIAKLTGHTPVEIPSPLVTDRIHSTLLRVSMLPAKVYAAPCSYSERQGLEVAKAANWPKGNQLAPFLLSDKKLYSFHDPNERNSPFGRLVNRKLVDDIDVLDLTADADGQRKLAQLLNSALRKHLGRKRIHFDKLHKRYFFAPFEVGKEREEHYKTLTDRHSSRRVVWNPVRRKTGEAKNHWLHLAASLNFHQLTPSTWGFSIRIERHITKDSVEPFPAEYVGRKVTRLKARMFNDAYLSEVHFWRDLLSGGTPRIILNFGKQSCVVDSDLLACDVRWLGVPGDTKPFTNLEYGEDLFTLGDLQLAMGESVESDHWLDDEDDG